MQQGAIVIPIYKEYNKLKNSEILSLIQCFKILRPHPIYFICPNGLNIDGYSLECNKIKLDQRFIYFDLEYFKDIMGYNKLLTSSLFFKKFHNFNFILIYQLDAWVFKDELEYWCKKGYDYIGAPWFDGLQYADESSEITGVGNGGFSLRNVSSSIRLQNRIIFLKKLRKFWFKSYLQALWRFPNMILYLKKWFHVSSINKLNLLLLEYPINEDAYWADIVAETFTDYKVANLEDSIKFSFEVNPRLLYKRNNNKLPFGCHAWEKYEPEFWKQFINVSDA